MKRIALLLLVLCLALPLMASCQAPAAVGLGQKFTLKVGQSAAVAGEGLTVSFFNVQEDSRCPTGAT